MTYAIVCRARAGRRLGIEVLMLVDRAKTRRLWWTSDDPTLAIRYRSEAAARFAAHRLRYNDAHVVPFEEAAREVRQQAADIMHHEIMADLEMGWDGYKEAF